MLTWASLFAITVRDMKRFQIADGHETANTRKPIAKNPKPPALTQALNSKVSRRFFLDMLFWYLGVGSPMDGGLSDIPHCRLLLSRVSFGISLLLAASLLPGACHHKSHSWWACSVGRRPRPRVFPEQVNSWQAFCNESLFGSFWLSGATSAFRAEGMRTPHLLAVWGVAQPV